MVKVEKKKSSLGKKILKIVGIVFLVVVLVMGALAMTYLGFFKEGNNSKYSVKHVEKIENSPLEGKKILFLGSSITLGMGSMNESFVDYLAKSDGVDGIKKAVSGTTLVDTGKNSYVSRLYKVDPTLKLDAAVYQLSTNDATKDLPLGKISDSFELKDFDTSTIIGSMETMISYTKETWNCPIIFYTNTKYDNATYSNMVDALLQLQQKWDIGVIDLWNDVQLNNVTSEQLSLYMKDDIHPTKAGYLLWWTPVIREYLIDYLK